MFIQRIVWVCLVALIPCNCTPLTPHTIMCLDEYFFVEADGLPQTIEAETIHNLYRLLKQHVVVSADDRFADLRDQLPIVVRFLEAGTSLRFPSGADGFAAMVGVARWECARLPGASDRWCVLSATQTERIDTDSIILVVVVDTGSRAENYGLLAHELTHILGASDGTLCPAHDDYGIVAATEPNLSDAYWWYGVSGMFTLTPSGIVWDALTGRCAQSDCPELCSELASVLAESL